MDGGRRPSLVFTARRVPVPANAGAPIRAHRLVTGLARRFEVVLVGFDRDIDASQDPPDAETVAAELPGVEVVALPAPQGSKRLSQLRSLPARRSWYSGQYARGGLRAAVRAAARDHGATLAHFDDPGAAMAGPVPGAFNVFAPHNIEHAIQRAQAERSAGLRRGFGQVETRKVLREERAQWRWADLCVAVSELDAQTMRRGGARQVVVAPNGTDAVPRQPVPRRALDEPLRLVFVGAPYLPNQLGVEWLVKEVLPLVRARVPIAVDVVGLLPDQAYEAPDVTVHGRVPSVDPYYERAHVAVVPIHDGSGSRLKVMEAMARGLPVVSTVLGATGLGLVPAVQYRAADHPGAFAGALVELAGELTEGADRLEPMLSAARAAAEELFWPRIAERLASAYEAALERRRQPERVA